MSDSTPSRPVVLITGAAGGLGLGMVRAFGAADWRVAAGWHRKPLPEESRAEITLPLDVCSADDIRSAADTITARFSGLDCLILNAGSLADSLLSGMAESEWDKVIDVHLHGARRCIGGFLPLLLPKAGQIIFISSFTARSGALGQANYAAAKAGMVGLALSIAREFGASGLRANVVFPGLLPTGMTASLSPAQYARIESANVLGRTNTIEEVSAFVAHLASMRGVSGQVFQLDSRISRWC